MAGIRLITFDLDDTLWAVDPVIDRANLRLCRWLTEHVPELDRELQPDDLHRARDHVLSRDPELAGFVTRLRLRVLQQLLDTAGVASDRVDSLARDAFEVFLDARHDIEFHAHAGEVLASLARDFRLAALTNGNADIFRLGPGHLFEFSLSAEEVGVGKPDPGLFLAAARAAACLPGEIVHVGDHPEHDIRGALDAGLHAIWVNLAGAEWPREDPPDLQVSCLSELPGAIRALDTRIRSASGSDE